MKVRLKIAGRDDVELEGDGRWLLGRAAHADIGFPDDPFCSREAAAIICEAGACAVEPVSTTSPVALDGAPIETRKPLRHGATLAFGEQTITIEILDAPAEPRRQLRSHAAAMAREERSGQTVEFAGGAAAAPDAGAPPLIRLDATITLGRSGSENAATLPHPTVSRRHAEVSVSGGGARVRDLNSTNGTFVNGAQVSGAQRLDPGDMLSIGPYTYEFQGGALHLVVRDTTTALAVYDLCVDVKNRVDGKPLRILDNVSLAIPRGSFVCIVGSSGSGKSTLMNLMAARRLASSGVVAMNGMDLVRNFAALKHNIAYVPQNNVLHETLTLREALTYAAELRLPPDLNAAARAALIEDAARSVDLDERLDMKIKDLSGGQKKRASLASETLSTPEVLFLDEVTSGLDESTDREIMALLRRRADDGMTVVCVTHTLANVEEYADMLIVMGRGGVPTYAGPPSGALGFFGVRRLGEMFDSLDERGPEPWRAKFETETPASLPDRPATGDGASKLPAAAQRSSLLGQFAVLCRRNTRLTLADRKNLLMALLQSTLIGVMLGYAYSEFGDAGQEITSQISLLMALGTASLWLGTNAASTAIVGEAQIFQRERDVNVSTIAFVMSKFTVAGVFSILQIAIVFALARTLAEDMPGDDRLQYAFLAVGALVGVGMGLAISAISSTQEQANTIVPLALIPQLVLAGVLVPALPEPGVIFSKISISAFWMTEGMTDVFIQGTDPAPAEFDPATGQPVPLEAEPMQLAFAVLFLHLGGLLITATAIALRRFSQKG